MNTDNEHFLEVQSRVFEDVLHEQDTEADPVSELLVFGPLFRLLPSRLTDVAIQKSWDNAVENGQARHEIEERYKIFAADIRNYLDTMDPELSTELTRCIEDKDVDRAYSILQTAGRMRATGAGD